jgi:hypothetical protein
VNPGGVVLVLFGIWVLVQVAAGDAIGRLNLVPAVSP